jgi:kynurenine formamidase
MKPSHSFLSKRCVDLTQTIAADMPVWSGDPLTVLEPWSRIEQNGFRLQRIAMGEHSGTHLGAPSHFIDNGTSVDQVPLSRLLAPGVKINLPADTPLLGLPEIERWEKIHGQLLPNAWILVQSQWSRYWNTDCYFQADFPGVSVEAVRFLCAARKIIGIGIDSPGVDSGRCIDFRANRCLAEYDALHLENLHRLELLPETGFTLFVGALPIVRGSGSPCRVLAMLE